MQSQVKTAANHVIKISLKQLRYDAWPYLPTTTQEMYQNRNRRIIRKATEQYKNFPSRQKALQLLLVSDLDTWRTDPRKLKDWTHGSILEKLIVTLGMR